MSCSKSAFRLKFVFGMRLTELFVYEFREDTNSDYAEREVPQHRPSLRVEFEPFISTILLQLPVEIELLSLRIAFWALTLASSRIDNIEFSAGFTIICKDQYQSVKILTKLTNPVFARHVKQR